MRFHTSMVANSAALSVGSTGCDKAESPSSSAPPDDGQRAPDLVAELKALKELIPDQALVTADVVEHIMSSWITGEAEIRPQLPTTTGEGVIKCDPRADRRL